MEPKCFIFSKEEQIDGILHYNCMLYRLYYEYIRNSGEYDSYRHYMECFYKSRNITNIDSMDEFSYQTSSSENELILIVNTPSYIDDNQMTPSDENTISSYDFSSNFIVSTKTIDISFIENTMTPIYPIKKKAKKCLCF